MTIGERAARAIKSRSKPRKFVAELQKLDIEINAFYRWTRGECDPSAYYLRQMALAGYDVIYILTGKENLHVDD